MTESHEHNPEHPSSADYLLSGAAWSIAHYGAHWTLQLLSEQDRAHNVLLRYEATVDGTLWHLLGHADAGGRPQSSLGSVLKELRWVLSSDGADKSAQELPERCDSLDAAAWASRLVTGGP
jgi:hypothetical protein